MPTHMSNQISAERVSTSTLVLVQRHQRHFQRGYASLATAIEPVGS